MEIKNELLNCAIIAGFLLSVSFLSSGGYPTNGGFSTLLKIRDAGKGSSGIFESVSYFAYSILGGGQTPEGMLSFFGNFSILLGLASALMLYFALRNYGLSGNSSLFAGMLFAGSSAAFFSFSPGNYSDASLALFAACLGVLLFSLAKKWKVLLALSGAAFLFSALLSPEFSLLGIAFGAGICVEAAKRGKGFDAGAYAIPGITALACAGAGFSSGLFFSQAAPIQSLFDLKFVLPLAGIVLSSIPRNLEREGDAFLLALFTVGVFSLFLPPYPGLLLFSFLAGAGIEWLLSEEKKGREERAAAYASLAFFFGFSFAGFSDPLRALVLGGTLAVSLTAVLYVFKFNSKEVAFGATALLLLSSSAGAVLLAGGQAVETGGREVSGLSMREYEAYVWISENVPQGEKIAVLWDGPSAEIVSEREVLEGGRGLVRFLAGNASAGELSKEGITYFVVSSKIFDSAQRFREVSGTSFRVESFRYLANATAPEGKTLLFGSQTGAYLARPVSQDGKFLVQDSYYLNQQGVALGVVPYSSVFQLDSSLTPDNPENRQVWVQGIYGTNVFGIFFGEVSGLEIVYSNPQAKVARVLG